jgi:hypothetical protein
LPLLSEKEKFTANVLDTVDGPAYTMLDVGAVPFVV